MASRMHATQRRLRVEIEGHQGGVHLSPSGDSQPFETEHFEGSVFFVHKPTQQTSRGESAPPFAYDKFLANRGSPTPLWELQIQGRFKAKPSGTLFFGFELRDGPMQLSLVTRACANAILRFGSSLAKQRGLDLRYSFGRANKERPLLAFPLKGADRIYCSQTALELPILGDDRKGVWRHENGAWVDMDRDSISFDENMYFTFLFASCRIDWTSWTVPGIPGFGALQLEDFWGRQAAHVVIFDESSSPSADRRLYFNLKLQAPRSSSTDATQVQSHVSSPAASSRQLEPVQPDIDGSTSLAKYGNDSIEAYPANLIDGKGSSMSVDVERRADIGANELTSVRSNGDETCCIEKTLIDIVDISGRPVLGSRVRISSVGRCGVVIKDDSSDLPFKVEFFDGALPTFDWFKEADVELETPSSAPASSADSVDSVASSPSEHGEYIPAPHTLVKDKSDSVSVSPALPKESDGFASPPTTPDNSRLVAKAENLRAETPMLPWYFIGRDGLLWWCVLLGDNACWRPHMHLEALIETIIPEMSTSFRDCSSAVCRENARRIAEKALLAGRAVPGLLDELLCVEVDLRQLVGESARAARRCWGDAVGIIEVEGCITGRLARVGPGPRLLWCYHETNDIAAIDLRGGQIDTMTLLGTPALQLTLPTRQFILVFGHAALATRWADALRTACAFESMTSPTDPSWIDVPVAWTCNRIVLNNVSLDLGATQREPLDLSAGLLRKAINTQRVRSRSAIRRLGIHACYLRCLDLSGLNSQSVWCFWLNVYHSLLIHIQLTRGHVAKLQDLAKMFNSYSYIVAGHPFSLTEIEHSILRHHMSPPHFRFRTFLLKTWKRSDADLEQRPCLAAPRAPASSFRCRPDWRLNLVLSAGNGGSSDSVPVFEHCDEAAFDALVERAMNRTLMCTGSVGNYSITLPYVLKRYRDDAPRNSICPDEDSEVRWARALFPDQFDTYAVAATRTTRDPKIRYATTYDWSMRRDGLLEL
eukprot:TRINITY_DN29762_c0_g1_i1.p1 TRINITY_DN29762_c0_g1~~TRINITY_DN29762_c0_g1_i1.p1  ORF type:complete len:992 (+),score=73.77 TRINITY_DN29762_c0_g1_i1:200-3175(+)